MKTQSVIISLIGVLSSIGLTQSVAKAAEFGFTSEATFIDFRWRNIQRPDRFTVQPLERGFSMFALYDGLPSNIVAAQGVDLTVASGTPPTGVIGLASAKNGTALLTSPGSPGEYCITFKIESIGSGVVPAGIQADNTLQEAICVVTTPNVGSREQQADIYYFLTAPQRQLRVYEGDLVALGAYSGAFGSLTNLGFTEILTPEAGFLEDNPSFTPSFDYFSTDCSDPDADCITADEIISASVFEPSLANTLLLLFPVMIGTRYFKNRSKT